MIVRIALLVLLIASAFSLVSARQRERKAFIEIERTQNEARQLDQDWSQLQLAQTAAAKHTTIEQVARQQLGMRAVTPDRTQYIAAPALAGARR